MPKYTVYLQTVITVGIEVEADDPDAAVEKAYETAPREICAQCSGWREKWTKSEGEYEANSVYDADDKQVWGEGTPDSTEGEA